MFLNRVLLSASALLLASSGVMAQTQSDSCSGATTPLTYGTPVSFSLASATYNPGELDISSINIFYRTGPLKYQPIPVSSLQSRDVWFRYHATITGTGAVNVANDIPVVSIFDASDPNTCTAVGADIFSNRIFNPEHIPFPVIANHDYLIRLGDLDDGSGAGTITAVAPIGPPPSNDECGINATAITLVNNAATIPVDTTTARNSSLIVQECINPQDHDNYDLWYSFTSPVAGTLVISTCGTYNFSVALTGLPSCTPNDPNVGREGKFLPGSVNCGSDTTCYLGFQAGSDFNKGFLSMPVEANVKRYVRVSWSGGGGSRHLDALTGTATMNVQFYPVPANDNCTTVAATAGVGPGTHSFSTFSATLDQLTSCSTDPLLTDVWFKYKPTQTGLVTLYTCTYSSDEQFLTSITAYDTCGGPELLGCDTFEKDQCFPAYQLEAKQGLLQLKTTANVPILIRIASTMTVPHLPTRGTLHIIESALPASQWFEGNSADASDLPNANAQTVTGNGLVTTILGNIIADDRADFYKVTICQPSSFSAKLGISAYTGDVPADIIYLFRADGTGVSAVAQLQANITGNDVPLTVPGLTAGTYYLCVASQAYLPLDINDNLLWNPNDFAQTNLPHAAHTPMNTTPIVDWLLISASPTRHVPYTLQLSGVCFFGSTPFCVADHNHSGTVTVQDIFSFLSAWFAGNVSADANASGTITVQDIFFFLSRWFAGC